LSESASLVQADFDRIALVSTEGWNHNNHYHGYLLERIPPRCKAALDIGCGTGSFSRLLAQRSERVVALDLSPRMIEVARERSADTPNIEFEVADVTRRDFPPEAFDCVASIATLHHLPLDETLAKVKRTLRPGGVLAALDLYEAAGASELLVAAAAIPVSSLLRIIKTGRLRDRREVREAWDAHGPHDVYPTLAQVRRACARALPGAVVRRHFLWRYSIAWRKAA
jgi:SAM-dependent methyltransferase